MPQLGKQQKPQPIVNNNDNQMASKKTENKNEKSNKDFKEGQYDSDEFAAFA